MSEFLKKFLLEDPRRFSPSGRFAGLAAFGKHPGWDDHVEDLGLETESLNFAKLVLYVNGIGGQIDSGAWEKLDQIQQLPGFDHLFIWQRSGQVLLGRMWSSSDGKGRKRYPMVVCVHFMGVPLQWALKQALPVLAELEQDCAKTTSAADVRSILARKRAALREAVQSFEGKAEHVPDIQETLHKVLNSGGSGALEGFVRVLYQMDGQLGAFSPGVFSARANPASVRVQQIRVPRAGTTIEEAVLFWTRLFLVYVDASVPLLMTLPLTAEWIDITAGEPESHEFFCLRATPKAVPLVSEVPYKLEDEFRSKATAFLNAFERGETARPDLKTTTSTPVSSTSSSQGGWLKWLGVGCIILLAGAAAFFFLPKSSGPEVVQLTKAEPPASTPKVATNRIPTQTTTQASPDNAVAEATRLAEEKKKSDAIAAAAQLKAEIEAAAKEKERQIAEAAAKEKERRVAEAAAQEKARQVAEAARKKELEEAAAKEKEIRAAAEAAKIEAEKQAALAKNPDDPGKAPAELVAAKVPAEDTSPKTQPPSSAPVASPATVPASPLSATGSQMTNSIGMVLVLLPSGLWAGKYEVTQAEYAHVMKTNPSNPKWLNDRQPVEQVTWNDAMEFTRKLTELEHTILPAGKAYSLPTEQQWKEICDGQTFEDLAGSTGNRREPALVGQSSPANKLGLYDVLGNLWEWCLDDQPGEQKLLKGGAFNSNNYDRALRPDAKSLSCGFRCVLTQAESH